MTQEELNKILEDHALWLEGKGGKRADLRRADLCEADLRGVNLRGANLYGADLSGANLYGADLSGANIDYSCWPLWCGSLNAHIDTCIAVQLLYHLMRPCLVSHDVDDAFKRALFTPELIEWANEFHRVGECGEIE